MTEIIRPPISRGWDYNLSKRPRDRLTPASQIGLKLFRGLGFLFERKIDRVGRKIFFDFFQYQCSWDKLILCGNFQQ